MARIAVCRRGRGGLCIDAPICREKGEKKKDNLTSPEKRKKAYHIHERKKKN